MSMIEVNEELRLKYRYLDIRRGDIAQKLVKRHQLMIATRKFLDQKGFLEISTPILGQVDSRRRPRLSGAFQGLSWYFLCTATIATDL